MNCAECREWLSPLEAGELDAERACLVREHLAGCAACSRVWTAMGRLDRLVGRLAEAAPARSACVRVLDAAEQSRQADLADAPEIMTPDELARFLRVAPGAMDEVIEAVPGFEIGGQLRFRKARVLEWIEEQERAQDRQAVYSRLHVV